MTKICSKCSIELPDDDFNWKSRDHKTRQSACKACSRLEGKSHYQRNKPLVKSKTITDARRRKNAYIELLKRFECVHCGEDDYCCFDFHHIDPKQKESDVSIMIGSASLLRLWTEIAKCVVLCANCHRKLHKGRFSLTDQEVDKFKTLYATVCPLASNQEKG